MNRYRLEEQESGYNCRTGQPHKRIVCLDCGRRWLLVAGVVRLMAEGHWCPAAEHPMYAGAKAAPGYCSPYMPWVLKKEWDAARRAARKAYEEHLAGVREYLALSTLSMLGHGYLAAAVGVPEPEPDQLDRWADEGGA